jgi:HKD family nuclease
MEQQTYRTSAARSQGLRLLACAAVVSVVVGLALSPNSLAQAPTIERLCDSAFENCRDESSTTTTTVLYWINHEPPTGGIDVSFWFMTDQRYRAALIQAWNRGVPVRVLCDLRATSTANQSNIQSLIDAGIPIRHKTTTGINHWKMMLYKGDLTPPAGYPALPPRVHFTGANFANGAYSPEPATNKYLNYVDEAIYFTDDQQIVQSFMTKYDDIWMDTVNFKNLANLTDADLVRSHPIYPISPDLNFPPDQDYQDRVVARLKLEPTRVDAVMFRITSGKIPDQLIKLVQAQVPVRLITDQNQYRNTTYFWHSYNLDRMYMAGVDIKWKDDATGQDMHQKSIVLHGIQTGAATGLAVFGSSNWTASSSDTQREHNYFTTKAWFVDWLKKQFERKWNNKKAPIDGGGDVTPPMYLDFVPGYPDAPVYVAPTNQALGVGSSVTLRWEGGWWAHRYDIYFGTTSTPPLVAQDAPGSGTAGVSSNKESYTITGLQPGVTYYWRVVSKTMANGMKPDGTTISRTKTGPTYSFTTSGGAAIPPAPTSLTAQAVSPTQVNLSWTDVAGEEGFKVERKLASSSTWSQIGTTGANVVSYADTNSGLTAGTSYNYRVRAYTTAGNSGYSNTATTSTPLPTLSARDVVLYASEATVRVGAWTPVADATAAGGSRLNNPNAGAAVVSTAQENPANYFEMDFTAPAGVGFRIWLRGKAYNDSGYSDSVHVQFSDSLSSAGGSAIYRIGTTSGTYVNLAEASGATIQGWGWQDNGFGTNVLGPLVYFATSGTHTLRVQVREDGFSIDQIVLSPDTYLTAAPGANKLDSTKLPKQNGVGSAPPPVGNLVVADTYVRGGSYASTSFGTVSELVVKKSADALYAREAFLKLDIGSVGATDTVQLRLSGLLSDTRAATVKTDLRAVANPGAVNESLTWNSSRAMAAGNVIGSVVVAGTSAQWYLVDITAYVQAQKAAGATEIAIALINPVEALPYTSFGSRESASRRPQLVISQ